MSLALFTLVYLWMSYTWYFYNKPQERPPVWRTAIQVILLTVFAAMTNFPVLLLGFVLISGLLHLNVKAWEPVHTGVVAGAVGGLLVVAHGVSIGYTPVEWATGDGQMATFAVAGAAMAAATTVTEWKGHPIQSVLITTGLRLPEHKIQPKGDFGYGETSSLASRADESHSSSATPDRQEVDNRADPVQNPFEGGKPDASAETNQPTSPVIQDGEDAPEVRASSTASESADGARGEDESPSDAATDIKEIVLDEDGVVVDDGEDDSEMSEYMYPWEQPPDLQFADIGGYHEVKDELMSQVIKPLRSDNESYVRFDVQPSRGLLFHGPPGTGKTLFARALANALDRPFVELSQADLTHEHINKSPQLIKRLFEEAQHLGGVVFIDEAEQLLGDRTNAENSHAEDQKVTNMFLSALTKEDQDFILLLTTNQRDGMDEAILRPGRVDSEFEIGLPDVEARTEILKLTVLGVPHKLGQEHAEHLAKKTEGWSGAELNALGNQAKLGAAERGATHLEWEDIKTAHREIEANKSRA